MCHSMSASSSLLLAILSAKNRMGRFVPETWPCEKPLLWSFTRMCSRNGSKAQSFESTKNITWLATHSWVAQLFTCSTLVQSLVGSFCYVRGRGGLRRTFWSIQTFRHTVIICGYIDPSNTNIPFQLQSLHYLSNTMNTVFTVSLLPHTNTCRLNRSQIQTQHPQHLLSKSPLLAFHPSEVHRLIIFESTTSRRLRPYRQQSQRLPTEWLPVDTAPVNSTQRLTSLTPSAQPQAARCAHIAALRLLRLTYYTSWGAWIYTVGVLYYIKDSQTFYHVPKVYLLVTSLLLASS